MRILVLGAGVLGSLYAAKLQTSGHDVTVLARGNRQVQIEEHGIVLEHEQTGAIQTTRLKTANTLAPDDRYELILVLVRKNQLASTLPLLAKSDCPNLLFMVNNAAGPAALVDAVGRERVLLGFPGAGGAREVHMVRYNIVSGLIQKTTIGELDGHTTPRLRSIQAALQQAGFPTAISPNMDAWLKTHIALISPIANAIYTTGSNYQLARTPAVVWWMIQAIREGYQVLHTLDIPITPRKLQVVEWLPTQVLVWGMQRALAGRWAETVIARHALAARDEMQTLADEFAVLIRRAAIATPAIDRLAASSYAPGKQIVR